MTKMFTFFTLLLVSIVFHVRSHPLSHQKQGRCAGTAVNYFRSVPSFRDCHKACENDERCCHYSYHGSDEGHHHHQHCFLYSSDECDINSLMISGHQDHWRTGWRAGCLKPSIFHRARPALVRMMWAAGSKHPTSTFSWFKNGNNLKVRKYWKGSFMMVPHRRNEEKRKEKGGLRLWRLVVDFFVVLLEKLTQHYKKSYVIS